MKKLFNAIRKSDLNIVKELIEKKPELVNCTAKQPPKKDDGQSPLQVAIKTGNFEIADYLLDMGADVNFMGSEECCNQWRIPVLHDAIRAAVMCSRWNIINYKDDMEISNTKEKSDNAFEILSRVLKSGADINGKDSSGNSSLERAILDARQILPQYVYSEDRLMENRIITDEITEDLTRIFNLLFEYGADCNQIRRTANVPLVEFYNKEPVGKFICLGK